MKKIMSEISRSKEERGNRRKSLFYRMLLEFESLRLSFWDFFIWAKITQPNFLQNNLIWKKPFNF